MRAAELAERIPGAKWVRDHWEALCRAHPDKNPPVKWKDQDDRVLVRCYAGCKTEDVLAAYGLTMADLFHHPKSQQPPGRQILRTYPYTDAAGRVVYEKVRYAPKDFRLRRPDGSGGWVWKLDGVERVLYHLDELVEQPDIHVTEGEDDTDVLRGIGLIATTNDSGADGWNDRHTAQLVAMGPRVVYVHEDNDAAGRERVATIANQVGAAAVEVRQVRYMDCGPGGDVRDALERFGAEALRARIAAAPVWAPDAENLGAGAETDEKQTEEDQGPKKTRYPEIEPLPLISVDELIDSPEPAGRFLVDRLLFDGGVSVIAGKPKAGKSTLVRTLGVAVARGATWLGRDVRQGPVVYISFEEKRGEVARLFDKLAARGLPIKPTSANPW
jgi:hypothetical protein